MNDENVGSRSSSSSRESTKTEGVLTFHVYPGFSLIQTLPNKRDRLFNTVKSIVYKNDLALYNAVDIKCEINVYLGFSLIPFLPKKLDRFSYQI